MYIQTHKIPILFNLFPAAVDVVSCVVFSMDEPRGDLVHRLHLLLLRSQRLLKVHVLLQQSLHRVQRVPHILVA